MFDLARVDIDKVARMANAFAQSGYFKDTDNVAQATVKIIAGAELGLGPMQAMQGIHIIKGKPTLSAALLGGLVKAHPHYDYRVIELDETACEVAFYQQSGEIGRSRFTLEDAKTAGLGGRDMWRQYPRNLLLARAISNGVRWYCPDVTMSPVYTPEELGAEVDEEGQVIDAAVVDQPSPKPPTIDPADPPKGHWSGEIERLAAMGDQTKLLKAACRLWPRLLRVTDDYRRQATIRAWADTVAAAAGPDELAKMLRWLGSKDWGAKGWAEATGILEAALDKLQAALSEQGPEQGPEPETWSEAPSDA